MGKPENTKGRPKSGGLPWWRGARGEWWVAGQVLCFGLVAFGPRNWPGGPAWPAVLVFPASVAGVLLGLAGAGLMAAAFFNLGPNLTPLPRPKQGGSLVSSGAYGLVRHPIYSGGICLGLGWALWVHGLMALAYVLLLFVFFDLKAAREERWLAEQYKGYGRYKARVKKLVPFIY